VQNICAILPYVCLDGFLLRIGQQVLRKEKKHGQSRLRTIDVAGPNDGPDLPLGEGGERLFAWYYSGDTDLPLPGTEMVFKVSRASAELIQATWSTIGAMVAGRRMFDIAHGWGGNPPGGGNCFIVTHTVPQEWVYKGSPFTFVTDGVESAVAQAKQAAGEKNVGISSASIAQQCLQADLLDGGVRLFDHLGALPIELENTSVVEAPGVTHLGFRVVK
jgi:dihydrofolate reductase